MATPRFMPPAQSKGYVPAVSSAPSYCNSSQTLYHDKVFVALDIVDNEFDLKGRIAGPNNAYLSHIQLTGARCWLRGKGSGCIEPETGREAFEALHIYLQHASPSGLSQAKLLAENLVQTVQQQYFQWRESHPWPQQQTAPHPPPPPPMAMMPPPPQAPPPPARPDCSPVFNVAGAPLPIQQFLPESMPPTTTQLIITDHNRITGAPTQQQVVIFKQEAPASTPVVQPQQGYASSSSSPPLLQETITTTTTTYYFPDSASLPPVFPPPEPPIAAMAPPPPRPPPPQAVVPPPVAPLPPVTYPLAMLPAAVGGNVTVTHCQPPTSWMTSPSPASTPAVYNPPHSSVPIRPSSNTASTFVAWSGDFLNQKLPKCSEASSSSKRHLKNEKTDKIHSQQNSCVNNNLQNNVHLNYNNRLKNSDITQAPLKRSKHKFDCEEESKSNSTSQVVVVKKKTEALSSLAVAYNNDNDD